MTESQQTDHPQGTRHTVVVPGSIDMVQLLGPGDDHLALIERSFDLRVHVRGNRITAWVMLAVFGMPVVFYVLRLVLAVLPG